MPDLMVTDHARQRAKERFGDEMVAELVAQEIVAQRSKAVSRGRLGTQWHRIRVNGALVKAAWCPKTLTLITVANVERHKRKKEDKSRFYEGGRMMGVPKSRIRRKKPAASVNCGEWRRRPDAGSHQLEGRAGARAGNIWSFNDDATTADR